MQVSNNGYLSKKFTEQGITLGGDKTRTGVAPNRFTDERSGAENKIYIISANADVPVESVVFDVLRNNIGELENYTCAKGETPKTKLGLMPLAIQCCILRLADIAKVSKILDTEDAHALLEIEDAENEAMQIGHPDYDFMLSPDSSAAIKIMCDMITERSGSASNFIELIKSSADQFQGFAVTEVADEFVHPPIGTASIGGSHLGNISDPDYYDDPEPWWGDTGASSGSSSGGSWLDKLFDTLQKAGKTIGDIGSQIGGALGQVKGGIGGIGGAIGGIGSDIGADSINKAMKKYIPYIIGFAVLILIILYVRRK